MPGNHQRQEWICAKKKVYRNWRESIDVQNKSQPKTPRETCKHRYISPLVIDNRKKRRKKEPIFLLAPVYLFGNRWSLLPRPEQSVTATAAAWMPGARLHHARRIHPSRFSCANLCQYLGQLLHSWYSIDLMFMFLSCCFSEYKILYFVISPSVHLPWVPGRRANAGWFSKWTLIVTAVRERESIF